MRKRYSKEFKAEAVRLVREESLSVAQAARDLGINDNTLYNWLASAAGDPVAEGKQPEAEELKRLRREVRQLRLERDILKKATAYFARSSSDDTSGL
ncbi:transposase [bacterium]|nr:transposase [bacterium]